MFLAAPQRRSFLDGREPDNNYSSPNERINVAIMRMTVLTTAPTSQGAKQLAPEIGIVLPIPYRVKYLAPVS
jgi:hypothetical protein